MFLSIIDFIAPRITLYNNKLLNHSSYPSIILSFIAIIIIITFSIIFSLDFIFYKNPTAFYYKRFIDDIGSFPLNSSSLLHFISFFNENGDADYDDTFLTVIGVEMNEQRIYEDKFNRTLYNHWIYGSCNENDINDKYVYLSIILTKSY